MVHKSPVRILEKSSSNDAQDVQIMIKKNSQSSFKSESSINLVEEEEKAPQIEVKKLDSHSQLSKSVNSAASKRSKLRRKNFKPSKSIPPEEKKQSLLDEDCEIHSQRSCSSKCSGSKRSVRHKQLLERNLKLKPSFKELEIKPSLFTPI